MSARPEWVKLYPHAFLNSRRYLRMTLEERGLYLTLLVHQAVHGEIPDDLEDIALIVTSSSANITEEHAAQAWTKRLDEAFPSLDGARMNPRMAEERRLAADSMRRKGRQNKENATRSGTGSGTGRERLVPTGTEKDSVVPTGPRQRRDKEEIEKRDSPSESKGAKAPAHAPKKAAPSKKKPPQRPLVDQAMEDLGRSEPWLQELCYEWADHREEPGTRATRVVLSTWKANVKKLGSYSEPVARSLVDAMLGGDWRQPVWENAQPADSQGPSAGRGYNGSNRSGFKQQEPRHYTPIQTMTAEEEKAARALWSRPQVLPNR